MNKILLLLLKALKEKPAEWICKMIYIFYQCFSEKLYGYFQTYRNKYWKQIVYSKYIMYIAVEVFQGVSLMMSIYSLLRGVSSIRYDFQIT